MQQRVAMGVASWQDTEASCSLQSSEMQRQMALVVPRYGGCLMFSWPERGQVASAQDLLSLWGYVCGHQVRSKRGIERNMPPESGQLLYRILAICVHPANVYNCVEPK